MRALVIGAGRMGRAAAWDLGRQPGVENVELADRDASALERAAVSTARLVAQSGSKATITARELDLDKTPSLAARLVGFDVVLSAADYRYNEALTRAAIEAKTNLCDLGGNLHVVERQIALDAAARRSKITVIPDTGLAPGLACVLAAGAVGRLGRADSVKIRVGGLPAHPRPPLNYKIVFSVRGLTNEYIEPSEVLRDGCAVRVPSLTEPEPIEFPPPFGTLEAFHTSGGASTLARTLADRVRNLDYKTIRYPGHLAAFAGMQAVGLFSEEPVDGVVPREFTERMLERALEDDDTDVVLMRVEATGAGDRHAERITFELIDRQSPETGHSAMARTTAYSAAAVAYMLGTGAIARHGVIPGELAIPFDAYLGAVRARGLDIVERRQ